MLSVGIRKSLDEIGVGLYITLKQCIAIDIGGTSIKSCIAEFDGSSIRLRSFSKTAHVRHATHELVESIVEIIERLQGIEDTSIVAISTHGSVDLNGVVISGPFFEGYANFSWHNNLKAALKGEQVKVYVLNDGHAAAVGSYVGDYRSTVDPLALFIVGTGIGGGIVCNGNLMKGHNGYAGLFGHIKLGNIGEAACICSCFGCVETLASGRALASEWLGRTARPSEVDDAIQELHRSLLAGDRPVRRMVAEAGAALGRTIGDIANVLDPGVIVVTGGILDATDERNGSNLFLEAARGAAYETSVLPIRETLRIDRSKLSNLALLGVAAYALGGNDGIVRAANSYSHGIFE